MPASLDRDKSISFTYTVEWRQTELVKKQRYDKYNNAKSTGFSVRYISLVNVLIAVLLIVLLTIFIIMKSLGNDFMNIEKDLNTNGFELDFRAERGWKMLHADVFRCPNRPIYLSTLIGFGAQAFFAFLLFIIGNFVFGNRLGKSAKLTLAFSSYAIAGFMGGYVGGGLFKRWGGTRWVYQVLIQTFSIPFAFAVAEVILNTVALIYKSTQVLRVSSIIVIVIVLALFVFP